MTLRPNPMPDPAKTCPSCGCEQDAGLLCHSETTILERELGDVAAIVGELDVTLSKQARIGTPGKSGLARERIPINTGAMLAADALANVLTTWARDLLDTPNSRWTEKLAASPTPTVTASRALLLMIPTIRRHPAVNELVDEITDAIRQARRAVDRPADRQYLGQCWMENPDEEGRQVTCLAELWARRTASEVQCKVCGAEHEVGERRAWLMVKAKDMIVTVKEAASYLGEVGDITVSEASIRGYLHRGKLAYRAPVEVKRFRLGDLLEVVLDEGERKSA